jgi:hypothetical protein
MNIASRVIRRRSDGKLASLVGPVGAMSQLPNPVDGKILLTYLTPSFTRFLSFNWKNPSASDLHQAALQQHLLNKIIASSLIHH